MHTESRQYKEVVVSPKDVTRALRISRSATHRIFREAGALKVSARTVRLPLHRLAAVIGDELAQLVISSINVAAGQA